jgi:periplasmic divalent cation tolerance protein
LEPPALLVLTSCPSAEAAGHLATSLIERHLAACVNCFDNVRSVYRWRGTIERSTESVLVIKTTPQRFAAVAEHIRAGSSYELPEILAVPVEEGAADYLSWVAASVAAVAGEENQ